MANGTRIAIGFIVESSDYTIKGKTILHIRSKSKDHKIAVPEPLLLDHPIGSHVKVEIEGKLSPTIQLGKLLHNVSKIL